MTRSVGWLTTYAAGLLFGCSAAPPAAHSFVASSPEVQVDERNNPNLPNEGYYAGDSPAPSYSMSTEPLELLGHSQRQRSNLSRDETFLSKPLPAALPRRYAAWHETARINVGKSHLSQIALLPSGQLVAMSEQEASVRVYEPTSKRLVVNIKVPGFTEFRTGSVLAWPGARGRIVVGGSRGVMLFDAVTGMLEKTLDERPVQALRWSADLRYLVALGNGAVEQHSVLHVFERTPSNDLTWVVSLDVEERVDAWDLSADNRLLALSLYPSGSLRVVDLLRDEAEVFRIQGPEFMGDVAFSPDGRLLAAGGDGLLVVDLLNSDRRAFYSFVYNNIGCVRFSPSGDALFASSYDGRLRIFEVSGVSDSTSNMRLSLSKELRHTGRSNVYGFAFTKDGSAITSVSGDQTLRTFSGSASPRRPAATLKYFYDLEGWATLEPRVSAPVPSPPEAPIVDGRSEAPAVTGPVRSSRILPGFYACKIATMYKLRDCWVTKDDDGRTRLKFAADNLLALDGVLYDDGSVVRYESTLQAPSTLIDCLGCERQLLHAVFRGANGRYTGLLLFRNYYDPQVPPPLPAADVKVEEALDRFPVVLEYRGPLSKAQ